MVFSADYTPQVMCDLMKAEGVTHTAGVPTVWLALINHVDSTGEDLGSAHHRPYRRLGGAAGDDRMVHGPRHPGRPRLGDDRDVAARHGRRRQRRLGRARAASSGSTCCASRAGCRSGSSFGPSTRRADVLPRDGKTSGRLQTRGPWIIRQYFQDGNGECIDGDGWFDTGDVAALHPDGVLQITDRSKDVIKSGGEWISSIDLENAAVGCPGVAEAAAVGVKHPKWDERPILLVVRKTGSDVTPQPDPRPSRGPCRQMVAPRRDPLRRQPAPHRDRQAAQDGAPRGISRLQAGQRGLNPPSLHAGRGRGWVRLRRSTGASDVPTPNPSLRAGRGIATATSAAALAAARTDPSAASSSPGSARASSPPSRSAPASAPPTAPSPASA